MQLYLQMSVQGCHANKKSFTLAHPEEDYRNKTSLFELNTKTNVHYFLFLAVNDRLFVELLALHVALMTPRARPVWGNFNAKAAVKGARESRSRINSAVFPLIKPLPRLK